MLISPALTLVEIEVESRILVLDGSGDGKQAQKNERNFWVNASTLRLVLLLCIDISPSQGRAFGFVIQCGPNKTHTKGSTGKLHSTVLQRLRLCFPVSGEHF